MCGIFGASFLYKEGAVPAYIKLLVEDLFILSESRGKEAAGIALRHNNRVEVFKSAVNAANMVKNVDYHEMLDRALADKSSFIHSSSKGRSVTAIGHSRLVTTGTQYSPNNNQPVISEFSIGIHNGIVTNYQDIWAKLPSLTKKNEVDSEVIFSLIQMFLLEENCLQKATQKTYDLIEGTASIACLLDNKTLLLATNNGSLYRCLSKNGNSFLFASEKYILSQILKRSHINQSFSEEMITQVKAGLGCIVDLGKLTVEEFKLSGDISEPYALEVESKIEIVELAGIPGNEKKLTHALKNVGLASSMDAPVAEYLDKISKQFPHDTEWQDSLRRCTKCILPETMPYIKFDNKGVCSYCNCASKLEFAGIDRLMAVIEPHRNCQDNADSVVGMSGGRDSLYSLHYAKTVLKLNPVAYTYDWGMVTDLARRNISRMCSKLGVEHILVSADITKKRRFIKHNVTAWLKRAELGMIPLFMAGDKQYFYYLCKVKKQLGVKLAILGENMLERTDFKTGFAGVSPAQEDKNHAYTLPLLKKFKLATFYGKEYLLNPGYLNVSLFDTVFAFASYYMNDRTYINLFKYIPWNEDEVIPTLINEYKFELSPDSRTTWRIGDGTAAFYNYIYYNVAGFTENETFRSNQIREGLITREQAVELVREENKPRLETIYWYLNIVNMDIGLEEVLKIISKIPKVKPFSSKK